MPTDTSSKCLRCGACCSLFVVVAPDDPYVPFNMTRPYGNWWHDLQAMRMRPDGYCIALKGKPGERCTCTIYDGRPRDCVEFEPRGGGCRWAREDAGFEDADTNAEDGTHPPVRRTGEGHS